jgi:multidrug efflux pump subunit AcrA (membrane-fusion protein)
MNLTAYLPEGSELKGVLVPKSAVVLWQGKSWVYVRKDADHFVRRETPTDVPTAEGWFVTQGLAPGDQTVVKGAQLLFSEEFRSQIKETEE